MIGWGVAQWPYMLPEIAEGVAGRRRRRARSKRCWSCSWLAAVIILPALGLLYTLDQKSLLEGVDAGDEVTAR